MDQEYEGFIQDLYDLHLYSRQLAGEFRGLSERLGEDERFKGEAVFFFLQSSELAGVVLSFMPGSPLAGDFRYPSLVARTTAILSVLVSPPSSAPAGPVE